MNEKKSTDVKEIYDEKYFLKQVDGFKEYGDFSGKHHQLFERYRRNISLLDLRKEHSYLEYGCGRGEVCIFHAARGGAVVGVDYSEDAIALAREKAKKLNFSIDFHVCSFSDFPAGENKFDRILASEFIEHISASEGAVFFELAYRALKPGGKLLVFTFPNTLQRKYGYPVFRLIMVLFGRRFPKVQTDMLSEHYKLYHLNEQNYFTLRDNARTAGFSELEIGYDIGYYEKSGFLKNTIKKIVQKSFLRHLFLTNLYLLAEK